MKSLTPFNKMDKGEYQDLLVKLSSDIWPSLSNKEKLEALQLVEIRTADLTNRAPVVVKPHSFEKDKPGTFTFGEYAGGNILLNKDLFKENNIFKNCVHTVMSTIVHEGRHAFQEMAVKGKVHAPREEVEMWKKDEPLGAPAYKYSPREIDARFFTDNCVPFLEREIVKAREKRDAIPQKKTDIPAKNKKSRD